ncbi:MAG TPA: ABC transporter permease [Stellaceae bacterium]|nr:ABC transporter permease [Stellaceae bacterium]
MLTLAGDWIVRSGHIPDFPADSFASAERGATLSFDHRGLGAWDSALIAFLWDVGRVSAAAAVTMDSAGLPASARKLLSLLPPRLQTTAPAPRPRFRPLYWLGGKTLDQCSELGLLSTMLVSFAGGCLRALRGHARIRAADLAANTRDAGPSALMIVTVVNFLIGAILAFVGAVQLKKFAADIYVADLVGLAVVREMAAVMTAIVIAGRTGGAYAARIATMRGNEELDALEVVGIPISEYIVLPALLGLVFTMPLLYLYGCLMGIVGGLVVALGMLNVTALGFIHQMLGIVPFSQFVFGFLKTVAFAIMIGLTSCRIGLKAGRSAADVGLAATRAVVTGIVGVIAMDALFAVLAEMVNI